LPKLHRHRFAAPSCAAAITAQPSRFSEDLVASRLAPRQKNLSWSMSWIVEERYRLGSEAADAVRAVLGSPRIVAPFSARADAHKG
jgi:hypothetical protein